MGSAFIFAFGIGVVAGLRSMLAPAVVAWAAHLGWLHLENSPLAFMGSKISLVVLSLAAIGELIADKLPRTPRRTAVAPLLARAMTGGLCGACLCVTVGYSLGLGIVLGAAGAIAGAFAGYELRRRLVGLGVKDFVVALGEDLFAVALALFLVSH